MTDYKQLCLDLFGTDDENELRKISKKLHCGRKKTMSEKDVQQAFSMLRDGKTTQETAEYFGISRQTLSKYLNPPLDGDFTMRMDYMYKQNVCTAIYIDYKNKKIKIINRTDDILKKPFGILSEPTWEDFEYFLSERCMPSTRATKKEILKSIGLDFYDPVQIIEKAQGRTPDDDFYIKITYREKMVF